MNKKDLIVVLEMAGILDVACQVYSRCDDGIGESIDLVRNELRCQLRNDSQLNKCNESDKFESTICKTDVHPTWFIGDGILLPPSDAQKNITSFWNALLRKTCSVYEGTIDLFDMLVVCGAHSLGLRILCESTSITGSILQITDSDKYMASMQDSFDETIQALLERNLGGSGSGITSSTIDSHQAVVFLLCNSPKKAFAAYKSCLPTLIKMQNFERLQILSNVGMVASSNVATMSTYGSSKHIGWTNQHKFFAQCQQIATKAKWWSLLQFYGLEFDSNLFADHTETNAMDTETECATYASSLVPFFVSNASKVLDSSQVLRFALKYSEMFNVSGYQVVVAIVEYMLLRSDKTFEISHHGSPDDEILRRSLQLLSPPMRCQCLRRCLMKMEDSTSFQGDYERFSVLLGLYHDCLTFLLDNDHTMQYALLETELEYIERRRDVLAILTSIFLCGRIVARPKFAGFFLPLPETLGHTSVVRHCGVLGKNSSSFFDDFDPLEPLEHVFSATYEISLMTALAALCTPLLIPNGYVHARSLMARFARARKGEIEFPPFNEDLIPVFNKLVSPSDRAVLADWCTNQYSKYDGYKLNCLSEYLNATIEASTEIEQRLRHFPTDTSLKQQERDFLEKIRSISSSKSTLSDFLQTTDRLRTYATLIPKILGQLVDCLIIALEQKIQEIPALTPEELVDFLFTSGSRLVSDICLKGESSFPIDYYRQFCSIIHSVCYDIAGQYSHIDVTDRARRLAHSWLFFGDVDTSIAHQCASSLVDQNALQDVDIIDEECTVDFVMDLSTVHRQNSDDYDHTAKGHIKGQAEHRTNSLEERSSLHSCTFRELSDAASQRSALRIAFVLASSVPKQSQPTDTIAQKENTGSNQYVQPDNSTRKRVGLLAKRYSRDNNNVFDLGLELLRIVFAKSGSQSNAMQRFHLKTLRSSTDNTKTDSQSTITFAMRHRALRVAAILCPHDVLEEIIRIEGMLTPSNNLEQLSLRQCSFGTFIAKEIEEIGLPLPHSELLQLSSMHFLSYARSLWRDHRDDVILEKSKGRFYLLLIELCLHNGQTDPQFLNQVVNEMVRQNLCRSLLQALEEVVEYETRVVASSHSITLASVKEAAMSIADAIFCDLENAIKNQQEFCSLHRTDLMYTFERLNKIILTILDADEVIAQYDKFIDLLIPEVNEPTLERLLTTTKQFRERAERQVLRL